MSDHDFEKQVRQKLEDLRLKPAAETWVNIEQGIQDGKRRRRAPFFWLPVLLMGLGVGGYLVLQENEVKREASTVKREPSTVKREALNAKDESLKDERSIQKNAVVEQDLPRVNQQQLALQRNNSNEDISTSDNSTRNNLSSEHVTKDGSTPAINDYQSKSLAYYSTLLNTVQSSLEKPLSGSQFNALVKFNSLPVSNISAVPPRIIHRKKWSFGVSAFAGISALNKGIFNFTDSKVADNARANAFAPAYTPSTLVPGFSYSIGAIVKRELSGKFSVTGGLSYLQMSTRNKVGNKVFGSPALTASNGGNQLVRNFFTLDQHEPKDYTNVYHFIEVPVALHTRLIRSQKLPVYWNTGLAYSRLLNSNSVQFDGATGVYYSNEKLLNTSHVSVSTGFDFVLFEKAKYPLWFGPSAKYNVSRLLNKDVPENKNFLSLGIDLKLYLK